MRSSLFAKITLILLITALLGISLTRISFLVDERAARRNEVVANIAAATARDQTVVGPVLVVPYTRITTRIGGDSNKATPPVESSGWNVSATTEDKAAITTLGASNRSADVLYLLPAQLAIDTELTTEQIRRSVHHAVVFTSRVVLKGRFTSDDDGFKPAANEQIVFGEPRLIVGISDPRGLLRAPVLTWGEQQLNFVPGTAESGMSSGIHVPLRGLDLSGVWSKEFSFTLDLRGTQAFALAPVGATTQISVRGDWPHPSFYGQFLPETREVTQTGFSAAWSTTWLATNMLPRLREYWRNDQSLESLMGVRFLDPADSYVQTDRAIKYGLLFVGLTFVAFFLFEILKRLAIHPLQYTLAGAALVLFYLLLLALSEHLPFALSYAIATLGCVTLLSYYLAYVLGGLRWGLAFGGLIGAVFGLLYVLISLEDHALLAGSLSLFVALALTMTLTRKVNWYALGETLAER